LSGNQFHFPSPVPRAGKKSKLPRNIGLLVGGFFFAFSYFNLYLWLSGLVPAGQFTKFLFQVQPPMLLYLLILPLGIRWLNQSRLIVHALKREEEVSDQMIQSGQEGILGFPPKMVFTFVILTIAVTAITGILFALVLSAPASRVLIFVVLSIFTGMIVAWGLYFGVKMLSRDNAEWLMHEIRLRGLPRQGRSFPLSIKVFTGIFILVFYLLSLFAVMIHFRGDQGIPPGPALYIFLVGGSVCLIFAWFLTNDVAYSVRGLNRFVSEVAAGNLEAECRFITEDELGDVGFAALEMARNLARTWQRSKELMDKMLDTARQMEGAVKRGLAESREQASMALEQSTTIHEVSVTAEEVAATGRSISERIQGVARLSKETLQSCHRGQESAQRAGRAIDQLEEHQSSLQQELESLLQRSSRIQDIVSLIDGVAEQIDMLALNAALEAAGAGEAGMRFSVVAKETKRLAAQTVQAVSEVRVIIQAIQSAVNEFQRKHGQALEAIEMQSGRVRDTGTALVEIVDRMESTAGAAEKIRLGSSEQAYALEEVQKILSELNVSAQGIAEGSRQVEVIMKEISSLAAELESAEKSEKSLVE
jgi:methyl-accepting chemotaxis protein